MDSDLTFEPLTTVSLTQLAESLNRAFTGYIVPAQFNPVFVAGMIAREAIDLSASRHVLRDGQFSGVGLIARRGTTSRLAAMGIYPEARRSGVGRGLMTQLTADARERGDRTLLLEVIEQNEAAVQLYSAVGFEKIRRLVGYSVEPGEGVADNDLREVDISCVAQEVMAHGAPDLPWQCVAPTLAQMSHPTRAFQLGPAYAILSNPDQPAIAFWSVIVAPEHRRQGHATRLVRALMARYPGKRWRLTAIFPEENVSGFFESLGFTRDAISQFEMRLALTP